VSCILYGISHKTLDSDFIQEGADNIDLNTETIDGKNTMYSMARAVFPVVQGKKHKYQMHEGFQLNV
jgi:hypothetical protein